MTAPVGPRIGWEFLNPITAVSFFSLIFVACREVEEECWQLVVSARHSHALTTRRVLRLPTSFTISWAARTPFAHSIVSTSLATSRAARHRSASTSALRCNQPQPLQSRTHTECTSLRCWNPTSVQCPTPNIQCPASNGRARPRCHFEMKAPVGKRRGRLVEMQGACAPGLVAATIMDRGGH
jgi:hypothetical protein